MGAKSLLKRLENKVSSMDFADVLSWIRAGRFFDELSSTEQVRYCLYRYGEGFIKPPESLFDSMSFNYHFRLEYKPLPLSKSEIRENMLFIQEYMDKRNAEYNSPEAISKRKKGYEELQEIGRKRKEAFYAGLPMSTYPLPWEKP